MRQNNPSSEESKTDRCHFAQSSGSDVSDAAYGAVDDRYDIPITVDIPTLEEVFLNIRASAGLPPEGWNYIL